MSRYIDADELVKYFKDKYEPTDVIYFPYVLDDIDAQPTVDADLVEVKRCKDCRHAKDSAIHGMKYCETMQLTFDNDFYCGCGEE
jgi:hypothetical protein